MSQSTKIFNPGDFCAASAAEEILKKFRRVGPRVESFAMTGKYIMSRIAQE